MKWIRQRRGPEVVLLASILACVLEGAFRKWIFRETAGVSKYLCYFAKDIILFALIVFCRPRGRVIGDKIFRRILIVGLPLVIVGAALSAIHEINIVGAILSFRALIAFPILAYLAAGRLVGVKVDNIAFLIGGLTVLNAFLGYIQNHSPTDAAINYYANEDVAGAVAFEENVRAVGTFSYITGFANLATAGSWAGLSLLCLARRRLSYTVFGWGFYLASLLCALVSISRGTVITVLAMLVVLAVSGRNPIANLVKGLAAIVVTISLGYVLGLNPVAEQLRDAVISRHETSDDTIEGRAFDPVLEIGIAANAAPMGLGFGTEQVAGVFAETGVMSLGHFEYQFPRLVLETGLIGLAGFLVTCIGTLYVMFDARRRTMDDGLRRIFVLSMFLVGSYFYTNVAFNHFASFFAWVIVAITLASASRIGALATAPSGTRTMPMPALSSGVP